jgi:hypothetical protein
MLAKLFTTLHYVEPHHTPHVSPSRFELNGDVQHGENGRGERYSSRQPSINHHFSESIEIHFTL